MEIEAKILSLFGSEVIKHLLCSTQLSMKQLNIAILTSMSQIKVTLSKTENETSIDSAILIFIGVQLG